MVSANELLADIKELKSNWNEREMFTLKGVSNLTLSDVEALELYAEEYLTAGGIHGLMEPQGSIKEVLKKYGITNPYSW